MRFTFASSAFETSVLRSSLRLSFEDFEVRMCRMKACARLTLPVPVFLKRLAAPECVFSLYIAFSFQGSRSGRIAIHCGINSLAEESGIGRTGSKNVFDVTTVLE